jgi:ABC-type taurine transport system substrate-binding protein
MYTSLDPNEAKVYIEAFIKDTGIKVDWVRMSAGEVLTRIKAEGKKRFRIGPAGLVARWVRAAPRDCRMSGATR